MSRPRGFKLTEEHKLKIKNTLLGHPVSILSRRKMRIAQLGKKHTESEKEKISIAVKARPHTWGDKIARSIKRYWDKVGRTGDINLRIRNSKEYKVWREAVFGRDNYTCQICNQKGKYLNADHIKPFAYYPDLRFELSNGRTLCLECHRKTDTWGYKAVKYKYVEWYKNLSS